MNFYKVIVFYFCTILFFSCTQKLDFNQTEDFTISPAYTASLVSFKLASNEFIDAATGNEIIRLEDESEFKIFQDSFFRDNLVKAVLNFKIKNRLNKDVILEINFLDQNDVVVYQFDQLYVSAQDLDFTHQETIEIRFNQDFLETVKTNFAISLVSSPTVIDTSAGNNLELQSSFTLYIETN